MVNGFGAGYRSRWYIGRWWFRLATDFPCPAPDQLGLDDLEERLDSGVDSLMFVKQEFELILLRRVRCRLRARCTF